MASSYPAALDNLRTDYTADDRADVVDHAGMHNDVNAAVEAVQAELGTDPSGTSTTVAQRLADIESGSRITAVALAKVTGAGTSASRDVPASGDAAGGQVVKGDDTRLTNSRTPTAHKTSHATGGSDPLTPADIGAATAAQGGKADTAVQPARSVATGTGLTGGGDLSADRTISVAPGGIGATQLADGSVTSAKIADGTITNTDIAPGAGIDVNKLSPVPANFGQVTNKGDLLAGISAGTVARVPAATTPGMALLSDGPAATGMDWKALGNLLTPNQATCGDTDGNLTGIVAINCSIALSTVWAASGTRSVLVTQTGGTNYRPRFSVPTTLWRALAGMTVTITATVRGESGTGTAEIWMATSLRNYRGASTPMLTAGTTRTLLHSFVVPADEATATPSGIDIFVADASGTGQVSVDNVGLWVGSGGLWQPPGPIIPNTGVWMTETATTGRACYAWDNVNNRWQMVYYDSGWRDVSATLVNGWTGSAFLRRADNQVFLRFDSLSGASATADTVLTIPSGFRSESTIQTLLPANVSDNTGVRARMTSAGAVSMARAVAAAVSATWVMSTTNPLPATLPGDAQGTIPSA